MTFSEFEGECSVLSFLLRRSPRCHFVRAEARAQKKQITEGFLFIPICPFILLCPKWVNFFFGYSQSLERKICWDMLLYLGKLEPLAYF